MNSKLAAEVKKEFNKAFAKRGMQGPHIEEAVMEAIAAIDKPPPDMPAPEPMPEEKTGDSEDETPEDLDY